MRYLYLLSALLALCLPPALWAQTIVAGGSVSPDGAEVVQLDFPPAQCTKNVGGTDGAGLCVFTSIGHSARWQNEKSLEDFQQKMRAERGGGWPEKTTQMIAKYGKRPDGTLPGYVQYEGSDLEILRVALRSGRMPAVTYSGKDGVFYKGPIAHMVNLIHLSDKWAAIRDNNYVEAQQILWLSPEQFRERWLGGRQGWAVVLLAPAPPPIPTLEKSPVPLPAPRYRHACDKVSSSPVGLSLRWLTFPECPGQHYLFRGRTQAGVWDARAAYFRSCLVEPLAWGAKLPQPPFPLTDTVCDYGVAVEHLGKTERFIVNGQQVVRAAALAKIAQKMLPDDTTKLRLTVIGGTADTVAHDLAASPLLAPWAERITIQAYPDANHWHLAGLGFPVSGVVIQQPPTADGRGKVLHQQLNYTGPADLVAALRKADPLYRPDLAPDLNRPLLPFPSDLPQPLVWVGGGLIVLYLLREKK